MTLHDELKEARSQLDKAYSIIMKLEQILKLGGGVAPDEPAPAPAPTPAPSTDLGKRKIKFGKHRDMTFDELPAPYLDWLRDQEFVETSHPDLYQYIHQNGDAIDKELDDAEEDWINKETPF